MQTSESLPPPHPRERALKLRLRGRDRSSSTERERNGKWERDDHFVRMRIPFHVFIDSTGNWKTLP